MKCSRICLMLAGFLLSPLSREEAGAQYTQQGDKLVGAGTVGHACQGLAVSVSADGNSAILGGLNDGDGLGAAWVFTRTGDRWTQQGKLVGADALGCPYQGRSVSISADGSTAVVGGNYDDIGEGATWVFTRHGGLWQQEGQKLVGTDGMSGPRQGVSVSVSSDGNTILVGGYNDRSGTGAVWVFTRESGVWTQQGEKLVGRGAVGHARQGYSVAVSAEGNTAVVGGYYDDAGVGAAWVFTKSGCLWSQQGEKLVGSNGVGPSRQGGSVSISSDGNTVLVGGYNDDNGAGAAWVFTRNGGAWSQQGGKLVGTGAVGGANQGRSVSVAPDGDMAIVGGSEDDSGKGAAWVFTRNGDVWSQEGRKLVGSGAAGNASQGWSVSVSTGGRTVVLGGYGDSLEVGAAWVFVRIISVVDDQEGRSPQPFDCVGNYPNPFNGTTTITYRLSAASAVRLTVYDLLGREMSVLVNERRDAGIHDAKFEGSGLASGVYMYRVTAEGVTQTRKLILLR